MSTASPKRHGEYSTDMTRGGPTVPSREAATRSRIVLWTWDAERGRSCPAPRRRGNQAAVLQPLLQLLCWSFLGIVTTYLALALWWIPHFGIGYVERIRQLGLHLDQHLPPSTVVLLGNSVILEGIDAEMVAPSDRSAVGSLAWAENLAIVGATPIEQKIVLPTIMQARPRAVVLTCDVLSVCNRPELPKDKAYAYALSDFVKDWPSDWKRSDFPELTAADYARLRSRRYTQLLHFRGAPRAFGNEFVRHRLRRDLRCDRTADWTNPSELQVSFSGDRLEWHLNSVRSGFQPHHGRLRAAVATMEDMVRLATQHQVAAVVVCSPIHPGLQKVANGTNVVLEHELRQMCRATHTPFLNCFQLLESAAFADARHPNDLGRSIYSRRIS
ncbi:MAG TPA: hypothetical protein VIY86_13025, partial [Pirellulaceae bacterium]